MPCSGRFWSAVVAITTLGGCAVEDGRPPQARIDISPGAIPEDDNFETAVTLDGSASADPIDDPDGSEALDFAWEIIGVEVELEPGSKLTSEAPVIRLRGDRPATVTLTVTDPDGLSSTTSAAIQLTVD